MPSVDDLDRGTRQDAPPTIIEPTVGRVVWFWPVGQNDMNEQPCAALVTYVHGPRLINVGGFNHNGDHFKRTSCTLVQEGDAKPEKNYCTWMPYQVGQAKKNA